MRVPPAQGASIPGAEAGPPARLSPWLLATAALIAVLVVGTVALWAHYGTAVFYEMIVAGIAACL